MSDVSPAQSSQTTSRPKRSSTSVTSRVTLVAAVLVLAALLIFVAQNSQRVRVRYFGADTAFSLSIGLLLAAAAGVVVTVLTTLVLRVHRGRRDKR